MYINVAGLEKVGDYSWVVTVDGNEVKRGSDNVVKYQIPEDQLGGTLIVASKYQGRQYQVLVDSSSTSATTSEFVYQIAAPTEHIVGESWKNNEVYPINNVFTFTVARCGNCNPQNIQRVERNEIRIIAETEDGRDLLDFVEVDQGKDPSTGFDRPTKVKFYLKGKVNRGDGSAATINIRFGNESKTYPVYIYRPD